MRKYRCVCEWVRLSGVCVGEVGVVVLSAVTPLRDFRESVGVVWCVL